MIANIVTHALKTEDKKHIKTFQVKGLRQTLEGKWTKKERNEWILEKAGTEAQLWEVIEKEANRLWTNREEMWKLSTPDDKEATGH